jgi:hypothetical protein
MTREVIGYQLTKKVSYKLIRKPNKLAKEPIENRSLRKRLEQRLIGSGNAPMKLIDALSCCLPSYGS